MTTSTMQPDRLEALAFWISEREFIRVQKEVKGLPKPWTANEVLQTTRFCNVRRMDDKVSRWLLKNWYPKMAPAGSHAGQVMCAAALARLINWPDTLQVLLDQGPAPWDIKNAIATLREYRDRPPKGNKIFTGAYIINASGGGSDDKIQVVCRQAETLFRHPELLNTDSMAATHASLSRVNGIGSFMAGQLVADLRHVVKGKWADKMVWAPLGPGSHRGLNWLYGWDGLDKLPRMTQVEFEVGLTQLMAWFPQRLPEVYKDRKVEAHDVQNCLCEYDKFMRLTKGTGRGKNQYPGI